MAQIIEFRRHNGCAARPGAATPSLAEAAAVGSMLTQPPACPGSATRRLAGRLAAASMVALGICWPMLRWVLSLDVVLQLLRLLWSWDTPGTHAGWSVLAHFALLTGLTCLVSTCRLPGRHAPL